MDTLKSEAASNHGHITKRLFPALEAKFASLKNSLATTTQALEAKGESLLAKCTALEEKVSSIVERQLESLESSVESPHAPALRPPGPREPPDDPPHGTTPGTLATPRCAGVLAGSFVPQDGAATRPCVERDNVDEEVDTSPVDAQLDVNARTRLAYDNERALNLPSYAGPHHNPSRAPATTRHDASPVCNTYP